MNTFTPTLSLRVNVISGTGYIGSHGIKHQLRRCCDIDSFDNLSASCHGPVCMGATMLPGDLAIRMDPVIRLLHLPASNKHRAADSKVAYN